MSARKISYHSNITWATAKLVNLIILIYMTTNAESLVIANIFSGICWFLPSSPKRCICYPRNLCGYWTDLDKTCTRCSYNIAIEYFLIGTATFLSFSEWQLVKWSFCQFCPKSVAMAMSLDESEKRPRSITHKYYHLVKKSVKWILR